MCVSRVYEKNLSFLSLIFILIPCTFLLSACGTPSETGFKVMLNGENVFSQVIEDSYGEEIDLDVISIFDDDTTKAVSTSDFTLIDSRNIVGTTPSVGIYEFTFDPISFPEEQIIFTIIVTE